MAGQELRGLQFRSLCDAFAKVVLAAVTLSCFVYGWVGLACPPGQSAFQCAPLSLRGPRRGRAEVVYATFGATTNSNFTDNFKSNDGWLARAQTCYPSLVGQLHQFKDFAWSRCAVSQAPTPDVTGLLRAARPLR